MTRARTRRPLLAAWFVLAAGSLAIWWWSAAGDRSSDLTIGGDAAGAEIVAAMAVIGWPAAASVGALGALRWPWKALGLAALVPLGVLLAVFSLVSGSRTCSDSGGPCSVTALVRYGGLGVILACCALGAATWTLLDRD